MKNLTFKIKMAGMGIFVLLSLMVLFVYNMISEGNRTVHEEIVATNYQQSIVLLNLRRNEKDFILRLDPKYLDRFRNNFSSFLSGNEHLVSLLNDQGIDTTEAIQVNGVAKSYADSIEKLGKAYIDRGLDQDSGYYGSLRSATHALEERLFEQNNDRALVLLLTLRRHEKDYMLRLDPKYIGRLADTAANLNRLIGDDSESTRLLDQYQAEFNQYVAITEQIGYDQNSGIRGEVRNSAHAIEELLTSATEKYQQEVDDYLAASRLTHIIMTLLFSGLILAVIYLISAQLLNAVTNFSEAFNRIRRSDDLTLRIEMNTDDELGRAADDFNQLFSYFHDLVKKIYVSIEKLEVATTSVGNSVQSTQSIIAQQTSKNEHVSESVEEMGRTARNIARNVEVTSDSVNSTNNNAQIGVSKVNDAITQVNSLAEALVKAEGDMSHLKSKSDGISSVLDVIRGIAEQTNLLALNAAIEAARAGEQGRGFAVVADEVRTLAMRTQESTEQITAIISELQESTTTISSSVIQCKEDGLESADRAREAGDVLSEIMTDMDTISGMAHEIAAAVDEQSHVVEQINDNVAEIKNLSKLVKEQSESNNDSVNDVSTQTSTLHEMIKIFKV